MNGIPSFNPAPKPVNDSGRYINTFLLTLHYAADNAQRSIQSQPGLGPFEEPGPLHSLFQIMPSGLTIDMPLSPEMKLATDALLFSVNAYQGKVEELKQGGYNSEATKLSEMLQDIAINFNLPQKKEGTNITAYQEKPYSLAQLSAAINAIVWK